MARYVGTFIRVENHPNPDTYAYFIVDEQGITRKWSTPAANAGTVWTALGTDLIALATAQSPSQEVRSVRMDVETGAPVS